MKKIIIFGLFVFLYSASFMFLSSGYFLVGGSDVIDFVYSVSPAGKIVAILGMFVFGYLSFFGKKMKMLFRFIFAVMLLLSFVSSQSVVYSGKKNTIEYYVYGCRVDKIDMNPTDGQKIVLSKRMPGLVTLTKGEMSLTYVSLFHPFHLNVSEIQTF